MRSSKDFNFDEFEDLKDVEFIESLASKQIKQLKSSFKFNTNLKKTEIRLKRKEKEFVKTNT